MVTLRGFDNNETEIIEYAVQWFQSHYELFPVKINKKNFYSYKGWDAAYWSGYESISIYLNTTPGTLAATVVHELTHLFQCYKGIPKLPLYRKASTSWESYLLDPAEIHAFGVQYIYMKQHGHEICNPYHYYSSLGVDFSSLSF